MIGVHGHINDHQKTDYYEEQSHDFYLFFFFHKKDTIAAR